MRLILIRHGASVHSQRGIIASGAACPGLTDQGLEQARRLGARLPTTPETESGYVLLSSPALRAYQTAEAVAGAGNSHPIIRDSHLTEINPGEAEGLTWDAYRSRFGAFDLTAEPNRPFAPGGESWQQYTDRVSAALARLAETYAGQTVVAVTHAGFIVVSMLVLFEVPRAAKGWLEPLHTSLTVWQAAPEHWTLERYNDALHLTATD
jgi:probable phosphoglycerate mutase